MKKQKGLRKKKPMQLLLFPQFDLESVSVLFEEINDHLNEIERIERRAKREIRQACKGVRSVMRVILELSRVHRRLFFEGKRKSAKLRDFLGWSKRRPVIELTKKPEEIVEYLEANKLSKFVKKEPDLSALKKNHKLARTIPGVELIPQENVIWVKGLSKQIRLGMESMTLVDRLSKL